MKALSVFLCSKSKELRFSYDICDEEKEFLKKRQAVLLKNFSNIDLGGKTPKSENEVTVKNFL